MKGGERFVFVNKHDSAFIELHEVYKTEFQDDEAKAKKYAEQKFIDRSCHFF